MWITHQVNSFLNLGICKEYLFMAKKPRFRGNPTRSEENVSNTNPPTNEVVMNAPVSSGTLEVPRAKVDSKKARMQKTAAAGNGNAIPINLEDEIRRRAYELYAERGFSSGHEHEDWLRAEREVKQRYGQVRTA
jgi:hypothetical protein